MRRTHKDRLGATKVERELFAQNLRRHERSDGLDALVVELGNGLLDSELLLGLPGLRHDARSVGCPASQKVSEGGRKGNEAGRRQLASDSGMRMAGGKRRPTSSVQRSTRNVISSSEALTWRIQEKRQVSRGEGLEVRTRGRPIDRPASSRLCAAADEAEHR